MPLVMYKSGKPSWSKSQASLDQDQRPISTPPEALVS